MITPLYTWLVDVGLAGVLSTVTMAVSIRVRHFNPVNPTMQKCMELAGSAAQ
jgi:hypothetical protein